MVIGVDGPVPHVCNFHEWHGVVLGRQQLRPVRGRDTTFSSNTNIGLRRITFQIRQYECKPHVRHLRVRRRLLLGNQRRFATGRWDGDSENATYRRDVAYWCFIRLGIHQRSVHLRIDQFRDCLLLGHERRVTTRRRNDDVAFGCHIGQRKPGVQITQSQFTARVRRDADQGRLLLGIKRHRPTR